MISHIHKKGQWMFSYRYMNMSMGDMQIGTDKVSDDYIFTKYLMSSDKMKMEMHMLMAMYGLTNRLTLMGMVHYNNTSMRMTMLEGTTHVHNGMSGEEMDMNMRTSGFGDFKLHALYGVINQKRHHLLVSMGLNVPTGSISIKGDDNSMYPNQRLPYVMQMGSGSVDLLPGLNYLFQKGDISGSSQITSTIRITNNSLGYRWGNEITTNHWLAFTWLKNFSSSIRLEGTTSGRIKGEDPTLYAGYEPSANPSNYGGDKVSGFLGTNVHFRKGFLNSSRIGVEYGIPFYQNLYGPQMGIKSSLFASCSISL
jgi:hypothetical protein